MLTHPKKQCRVDTDHILCGLTVVEISLKIKPSSTGIYS